MSCRLIKAACHLLFMVILLRGCVSVAEHRDIIASIGDLVTFKCNWSDDAVQITWKRDELLLLSHKTNNTVKNFTSNRIHFQTDFSELNISNILRDDTGIYSCDVSVRTRQRTTTWNLNVTENTKEDNHAQPSWFLPLILSAAIAGVLSGIICSVWLYRKLRGQFTVPEEPIYENF